MVGLKEQSPFVRAFYDYLHSLPKSKNQNSVLSRIDVNDPPNAEKVQEAMLQVEAKHGQKASVRMMKRVMGPFVAVMKDYYCILDTLCQADPTPGIVLWGCLKIVIEGLGRFTDLFDKLKTEVLSMGTQMRRLILYEDLYGQSSEMQECLFKSYKDIFRFWCRVEKECNRCTFNSLLRASTSFSVKKLQGVLDDLKEDADQIDKLVPIIEGQNANHERLEASFERHESRKEREENSAWRKQLQSDRIINWLGGQTINASNWRKHQNNITIGKGDSTSDWLLKDPKFQSWATGDDVEPVLWLFAGPGAGKSVLCSHVVRHIQEHQQNLSLAFHFYEFDDQRTALFTAQVLATQLFERYWLMCHDIPEDLVIASQASNASLKNLEHFIRLLVAKLPMTYILIDGLDEEAHEARWNEAVKLVDLLLELAKTHPGKMRVWFSSQDRFVIRKRLDSFPTLDIKEHVKEAVDRYISLTVPGINNSEVYQDTRRWILDELRKRADGNFLWASLMLKAIENEVSNFDKMVHFIKKGLPGDLYSYYRRIFGQYVARERELASKIFALVTFAKRRLRMSELREAIGIVSSPGDTSLKAGSIPWRLAVEKLFGSLIEQQQDPKNVEDCFCHLFHSTVRSFLQDNPNVLCQNESNASIRPISEIVISNACLRYLAQQKYAQMLSKSSGDWITSSGERAKDHHFLTYSAKYWNRHLDEVQESPSLREETEDFIKSPNFATTLQIQSLFVEAQFQIFTQAGCSTHHKYTKRVFPRWLASQRHAEFSNLSPSYRTFIAEWNTLLHLPTCEDEQCRSVVYKGELNRCLWKAMGPRNFLSHNKGRYNSFILTGRNESKQFRTAPYCESIAADGSEVVILRLSSDDSLEQGKSSYHQETWTMGSNTEPELQRESTVTTSLDVQKWIQPSSNTTSGQQSAGLKLMSFTRDLSYIRIGSQLFSRCRQAGFQEIKSLSAIIHDSPNFFEELASRGSLVALTARREPPAHKDSRGRALKKGSPTVGMGNRRGLGPTLENVNSGCEVCSREPSRSKEDSKIIEHLDEGEESSDESSSQSTSDESEGWNSAEESWSEGSTEATEDERVPLNTLESSEDNEDSNTQSEDDTESIASVSETTSNAPVHSNGQLKQESDSEGGDFDFDCESSDESYEGDTDGSEYDDMSDDITFDSEDDEPRNLRYVSRKSKSKIKEQQGLLSIYDLCSGDPVQLFRFSQPLPTMLYESPPVIHPTKSLVVWPLCHGEILFGDFKDKTCFIRKVRPSTKNTRHISIQCHFSDCGNFLHMVSLEAQQQPLTKRERKSNDNKTLLLSAFISTHRLSTRKTSRSPPTMIHRAKVSLGSTKTLCPTRMPVEVTWSSTKVYLSSSSQLNRLALFRVDLFACNKPGNEESGTVSVPRNVILLPESARSRTVRYFPPKTESAHGLVFIGSWACKPKSDDASTTDPASEWDSVNGLTEATSPAIGFFVSEDVDLGGWGPSAAVAEISADTDKGQLKQKMERFVGEDDCDDLETYFFA